MILKILTQNVRGLNDSSAVDNLRQYLHRNPVDLLFIQEHKLRNLGAAELGCRVWKNATTFFTEATPGYTTDGISAGKGGVASLISPRWAKFVSSSGSMCDGRFHWFIMSNIPGGDLGFINLYAPHIPHPRKVMWETMT